MRRKLIRKRVQQVLKDANIPMVEDDVFCRKSVSHDDDELPYINIYPNSENVDRFDEAPKRYRRDFQITCEIVTTHDNDCLLADELDDIANYVEDAIENDSILQGYDPYDDDGSHIEDTEAISVQYDQEGNGSSPGGSVRLTFNVSYVHNPVSKRVLSPFNGLDTKWKIGDHKENRAEDKLNLPQD